MPADLSPRLVAPSPVEGVLLARARHPDRVALELGDRHLSYRELCALAGSIAAALGPVRGALVGVLASRSLTAYAGSLAVFGAGAAHVALNPEHPAVRQASVLDQAQVRTLLVGPEALDQVGPLLAEAPAVRRVVLPEGPVPPALAGAFPQVSFVGADALGPAPLVAPPVQAGDLAYLVFTSGSTGQPKGVAIEHGHFAHYMRNFREHVATPLPEDRLATTYELTFDIALHDMLQAWWSGAALCVVPARQLVAPARFIRDQRITWWFSVASAAMLMARQGTLRPGVFPLLKVSMLCGEPLPASAARAFAAAAPNSVLYNVYGPTETTMELAFYRWTEASEAECRHGIVPIGIPFPGHQHILLDEQGREVLGAGQGELLLEGPQVGAGYWKMPERTAQSFVTLPDRGGRWYRTGDLVERDEGGMYHFVSRMDHQIKLRGHRIELGEIEAALRVVAGTDLVAVIPFPVVEGNAQGLVAFLAGGDEPSTDDLRRGLEARLPAAMVPGRIERLDELPLNSNRKIDRGALLARLGG